MREKIAQIHNNTQRSYCDVYCDDSLACNSQGGCRMPGAVQHPKFLNSASCAFDQSDCENLIRCCTIADDKHTMFSTIENTNKYGCTMNVNTA